MKRISIIYCGGCNPRINLGQIAQKIRAFCIVNNFEVVYNSSDADFIIYLSGCTVNCARHYYSNSVPCTAIAANTIDGIETKEAELDLGVIEKVTRFIK